MQIEGKAMVKIVVADNASLVKDHSGFGHYIKVAKMYCSIFNDKADIKIAGGPIYKTVASNSIQLPYNVDIDSFANKRKSALNKIKMVVNAICLFKNVDDEIIVCQPYSFFSWMIGICLYGKKKKIYLIEYKNELKSMLNIFLYKIAAKNISGIICPNRDVGEAYKKPYIVVPDYIYDGRKNKGTALSKTEYDIGIVGIMSDGKDIEDVVTTYAGEKTTVLIEGFFQDKRRFEKLKSAATENIKIVDKYLTDQEYEGFFDKVKYVVLPYSEYYKNASSGVIFDIIFHGKPVITKRFENFEFVEKYNIGILYEKSLTEVKLNLTEDNKYSTMTKGIENYLLKNRRSADELLAFLTSRSNESCQGKQ